MLFRILGLLSTLFPIGWGIYSIHAGYNSQEFGPVLGGLFFMITGFLIMFIIVWTGLEQIVNKYPKGTPDGVLADGTIIEMKTAPRIRHSVNDPAEFDRLYAQAVERMNIPDPNLIHPDDLKRQQASGHDSYPRRDIKV